MKRQSALQLGTLAITLSAIGIAPNALAEGSINLNSSGGNRVFLEYRQNSQFASFGLAGSTPERVNVIRVYAESGETLNLASSANGVNDGDIIYRTPSGTSATCPRDTTPASGSDGYIANFSEELAGPGAGYNPCTVSVTETGVWEVIFRSPNHQATMANVMGGTEPQPSLSEPTPVAANAWTPQNNRDLDVTAWDVTVTNGGVPIPGRVFANYLATNVGAGPGSPASSLNSSAFILTQDGYLYTINLNGIQPQGFIFWADAEGLIDGSGTSTFQSAPESSAMFNNPANNSNVVDGGVTHKIFFNNPNLDLPATASFLGGTMGFDMMPDPPVPPTNFEFVGSEGTMGAAGTVEPQGGTFSFDAMGPGQYRIVLDLNQDGVLGNGNDRLLTGPIVDGTTTVEWDGLDGNGDPVPASDVAYQAELTTLNTGLVHFPFLDVENNTRGIIVQRQNGDGAPDPTIFYDDTPIGGSEALLGVDSSGGAHKWSGGFGNIQAINSWAVIPSEPVALAGEGFFIRQADIQVRKESSVDTMPPQVGSTVTYTIEVEIPDPPAGEVYTNVTGIGFTDEIPADITVTDFTCTLSAMVDGNRCDVMQTGNMLEGEIDLTVGSQVTMTVTGTIDSIPANGMLANTATTTRPDDITDPVDDDSSAMENCPDTNPNSANCTESATDTITFGPDLSIVKMASPANFIAGMEGIYTLTVSNDTEAGPTTGTISITDNLPNGLTFVSGSTADGWSCSAAGQAVTCMTNTVIPTGGSSEVMLTVMANNMASGSVMNTATVSTPGESNTGNNTSNEVRTEIINPPDLTVAVNSSPGSFIREGMASYSYTVTNAGGSDTTDPVEFTTTLPDGVDLNTAEFQSSQNGWSCTVTPDNRTITCTRDDTLPAGSSYPEIDIPVTITDMAPEEIVETASVSGGGEVNTSNNTGTRSNTVTDAVEGPDLIVDKMVMGNFVRGEMGTFQIVVTNSATMNPTDGTPVTITDMLPTGLTLNSTPTGTGWDCSASSGSNVECTRSEALDAGMSYDPITISVNVATDAPTSIMNVVDVMGGGDTVPDNNRDVETVTIATDPDLTIDKNRTGNFVQGGTGSYSLLVTNVGGATTMGTVTVTDTLPAGLMVMGTPTGSGWNCSVSGLSLTCTIASELAAGSSYAPINIPVTIAADAPEMLSNTATVSGGGESNTSNNSDTDMATLTTRLSGDGMTPGGGGGGTPVPSPTPGPAPAPAIAPDLVTSKTGPTSIMPGGSMTYTVVVTNQGNQAAADVTIRDTLPGGVTFESASDGGTVSGNVVTWPTLVSLQPGQSVSRTVTVTAPEEAGSLVNRATSTTSTAESNQGNNFASATTTIVDEDDDMDGDGETEEMGDSDVQVTVTPPSDPLIVGQPATFTIDTTNNGPETAEDVTIEIPIPSNVEVVSATPSQGTCEIQPNLVTCNLGDIEPGQVVTTELVVIPREPGPITIGATATIANNEVNSSDNSGTTTVEVLPDNADVRASITGPEEPIPAGEEAAFSIDVTNDGPATAVGSTLTYTLPEGVELVSITPSQGSCTVVDRVVTCELGDIEPGQSVTIDLVIIPSQPGILTTKVTANADNDDTPDNNMATNELEIVAREPRIRLVKRITAVVRGNTTNTFNDFIDDPNDEDDNAPGWSQLSPVGLLAVSPNTPLRSGDLVEYTVYFLSDGNVDASDVNLCDLIPENTVFMPESFGMQSGIELRFLGEETAITNPQDSDRGLFVSPLAPLPQNNACANQTNPNGAVLLNLGTVDNEPANNVGFFRFRVGIQ